jgi:para-nitrobenzyl esterase
MAIQPGNHLGPYEILAAIGAGGVGEVYRAHPSAIDRSRNAIRRSLTLFLCGILSLAFVPRSGATIQDPVRVEQGQLSGAAGRNPGVKIYRGIPYAAPPVGHLRWKPPKPAAKWKGVRQATEFSNGCVQLRPARHSPMAVNETLSQSEDCLYLNIWTPANSADDKLPVMFWIHGGGFIIGHGSAPAYEGENLARKGVVVVTINYRLGVFGFFALPELTAESPHHASGNYGLMDQIAALQWVKKNIAAFGGDPKNVTIFGQSAGSWAVNLLTASPLAKGLFEHAIGESGAGFADPTFSPMMTRTDAEKLGEKLAAGMGATQDVLKTLRAKPADEFLKATAGSLASPIVDGWVLPQDVETTYAQGKQNDVPTIVGNNANEFATIPMPLIGMPPVTTRAQFVAVVKQRYGDMAGQAIKLYPAESDAQATESAYALARDEWFGWNMREWARMQVRTGHHPAYRYYFSHRPPGPEGERLGAFHEIDLAYVFGNFTFPFPWDDTDRKLSETIMVYWTNFAKTGDPNGAGLSRWPAYSPADDNVLDFGDQVSVRTRVNQAGLDFFDAYRASLTSARPSGTGTK